MENKWKDENNTIPNGVILTEQEQHLLKRLVGTFSMTKLKSKGFSLIEAEIIRGWFYGDSK